MNKKLFITLIILSLTIPAMAADVYFTDGRVCQGCIAHKSNIGIVDSVKDKSGNEWIIPGEQGQVRIDPHPFLRRMGMGLAAGGQQFSQGMQRTAQPVNTMHTMNCTSYGITTNCTGW